MEEYTDFFKKGIQKEVTGREREGSRTVDPLIWEQWLMELSLIGGRVSIRTNNQDFWPR